MIRNRTSSSRIVPPYINSLQSYDTIGADEEGYLFFDEDGLPSVSNSVSAEAHNTSHENGGGDEINVAGLSGVLADPQTPAAHTHASADIISLAAEKLLGRGAGESGGPAQEITLGTNLSMSGTTLNATGGGGTPATTVTSETTWGVTPAVGVGTDFAREDHTHGSPPAPTAASVGADPAGTAATADAAHVAAGDPHAQYALEADLGTASSLDVGTGPGTVAAGNDSRFTDARAPTGAANGQLGGSYPGPDVRGLRETSGPTQLTYGDIADGQLLKRVGSTVVGTFIMVAIALILPPELATGINSAGATVGSLI